MTLRRSVSLWPVPLLVALASCGREGTPTQPSPSRSFLEGTWTGTLVIQREGQSLAATASDEITPADLGAVRAVPQVSRLVLAACSPCERPVMVIGASPWP